MFVSRLIIIALVTALGFFLVQPAPAQIHRSDGIIEYTEEMERQEVERLKKSLKEHPLEKEVDPVQEKWLQIKARADAEKVDERDEKGCDEFVAELLRPLVPVTDSDLGLNQEKARDFTAICRFAAEIRSVTPLYMAKGIFDFTPDLIQLYYRPNFKQRAAKISITRFPLMHLARQCGGKAVPVLLLIASDAALRNETRVRAFAVLYLIDPDAAKTFFQSIEADLSIRDRQVYAKFMRVPTEEVWLLPYDYHPRSGEDLRRLHERLYQKLYRQQ